MIRSFFTVVFLLFYFITSLPVYAILYLLRKVSPVTANKIALADVRWALGVVRAISGSRIEVQGLENIPTDQSVLYIGNHTSYFDIVTTYPVVPGRVGYLAKKEVNKVPLVGWWMPLLNGITMDRRDPRDGMRAILKAIDLINEGVSVFIFPEGTRMNEGELGDFKAGSFKVATRTGCPIVPVAITGTSDIFEKHIPFIRPSNVTIRFGEPVYPNELTREEIKTIAPLVKGKIEKML